MVDQVELRGEIRNILYLRLPQEIDANVCRTIADDFLALEASRHAGLVETLRIIADEQSWRGFSPAAVVERMRDLARAKLPHPNNTGEV